VGLGGSWGEEDDVHPRRQIQTADYKRKLKILSTGILKTTSGHGWGVLVGMGPGLRTQDPQTQTPTPPQSQSQSEGQTLFPAAV